MSATGWWAWAVCVAVSATLTTNPWMLAMILTVVGCVVAGCARARSSEERTTPYSVFLRVGLVIILIRVVFQILFGGRSGHTTLFTLPELALPAWMTGVHIGGPVTAEGVLAAAYDGVGLATLLITFGAAHTLGSAKRVLAHAPTVLYELSVAVVIAVTTAPQLVTRVGEIRRARTLRGESGSGIRSVPRILAPLLTDTIERSRELAASMESRGYGVLRHREKVHTRWAHSAVLLGAVALLVGVLGLLGLGTSLTLSSVFTALGVLGVGFGVFLHRHGGHRTQYHTEQLTLSGWIAVSSGVCAVLSVLLTKVGVLPGASALTPEASITPPGVPVWAALGVCAAVLPAFLNPSSPRGVQ